MAVHRLEQRVVVEPVAPAIANLAVLDALLAWMYRWRLFLRV